jgi:cell division protein FtsW (lipid II flippase)
MEKAFRFFMTDELCSVKQLPVFLFISGTLIGVFYNVFQLTFGAPAKEGFMEDYTTLLYVAAGIVLFISAFRIKRHFFSPRETRTILILLLLFIILLVFLFGEEVSWGQNVLDYNSPVVIQEYNYQHEVNVHNFFNPLFKYLYPAAGMSLFVVLLLTWLFDKGDKSHLFYLFCPSRSLFFFVFFMAASTYQGHSEIFEEMVSVFSLLYSIRLFFCLRYPLAKTPVNLD